MKTTYCRNARVTRANHDRLDKLWADVHVNIYNNVNRHKSLLMQGELSYLQRAQTADMRKRYAQRGAGALLVVRDDNKDVAACGGVQVQAYRGEAYRRRRQRRGSTHVRF